MISDRLNPIVVKELRQGLKSRAFFATFIGLQVGMVLSMFFYFAALGTGGSRSGADAFFWFMLGLMLLFVMPLRSFQTIHDEIKGNTLELLFLTRMTAWHISFGKWTALAVQSTLMLSAVMPYLVLRYFLGSVDIARDLFMVSAMFAISLMLIGVAVGLSAWKSKLLRGLLTAGSFMVLFSGISMFGGMYGYGRSPFSSMGWVDVLVLLLCGGIITMFFIEYGASQIAPPAENHAFRKRILAIALFSCLALYSIFSEEDVGPMSLAVVLLIPVMVDALCEPVLLIPSLYKTRHPRNPLRWILMPGWPSGVLFTLTFLAALASILLGMGGDLHETLAWILTLFNLLLFPIAVIVLIPGLQSKALPMYFVFQVTGFVITLFGGMFLSMSDRIVDEEILANFFPLFGLGLCLADNADDLRPALMLLPALVIALPILLRLPMPITRIRDLIRSE